MFQQDLDVVLNVSLRAPQRRQSQVRQGFLKVSDVPPSEGEVVEQISGASSPAVRNERKRPAQLDFNGFLIRMDGGQLVDQFGNRFQVPSAGEVMIGE